MLVNQRRMESTSGKYCNLQSKKICKAKAAFSSPLSWGGGAETEMLFLPASFSFILQVMLKTSCLARTWLYKAKMLWAFNKFIVLLFSISFELYSVRNTLQSDWWILLWYVRLWVSHSLFCHHHIVSPPFCLCFLRQNGQSSSKRPKCITGIQSFTAWHLQSNNLLNTWYIHQKPT